MRLNVVLTLAAVLLTAAPLGAFAADAQRGSSRGYDRRAAGDGEVIVERIPRSRGISIQKFAGERYRVIDSDGTVLTRSYPDVPPPRRLERRIYVREGDPGRPFQLYGGFYGPGRWGYSREDW